jgi:hypothetical protein
MGSYFAGDLLWRRCYQTWDAGFGYDVAIAIATNGLGAMIETGFIS